MDETLARPRPSRRPVRRESQCACEDSAATMPWWPKAATTGSACCCAEFQPWRAEEGSAPFQHAAVPSLSMLEAIPGCQVPTAIPRPWLRAARPDRRHHFSRLQYYLVVSLKECKAGSSPTSSATDYAELSVSDRLYRLDRQATNYIGPHCE